jgi:hypothetical protein
LQDATDRAEAQAWQGFGGAPREDEDVAKGDLLRELFANEPGRAKNGGSVAPIGQRSGEILGRGVRVEMNGSTSGAKVVDEVGCGVVRTRRKRGQLVLTLGCSADIFKCLPLHKASKK